MSDKITANPDDGRPLEPSTPQAPVKSPAPKKPRTGLRTLAYVFGSLLALLILLTAGISWYATTTDFQQRVGGEVVSVLENATGGRVELKHLSFNPWRLAIEVDGLVIHGTEAPGQMPYLSAGEDLSSAAPEHGARAHSRARAAVADQPAVSARGAAADSSDRR